MTVKVSKPAINVREELADLKKPTGIAGEAMLRAETPQEQFNLIGAGRRNWIINGSHIINQRNVLPVTGMANNNYEATDRWKTYLANISSNASLSNGYLKATASASDGRMGFHQFVEDYSILAGNQLTASVKMKSNNPNARLSIYDGTTVFTKEIPNADGTEQSFSVTATISSSATTVRVYAIIASETHADTTIASGDYIEFTQVQLELGKVATPFEHRSYGEELALCQRYFQLLGHTGSAFPIGYGYLYNNGTKSVFTIDLTTPMRATPSVVAASSGLGLRSETSTTTLSPSHYTVGYLQNATKVRLSSGSNTHADLGNTNQPAFLTNTSTDETIELNAEL